MRNKLRYYNLILRKLCRIICFFSLAFFFIFLDQICKLLAVSFQLFPVSYNKGISFGFLPSNWWLAVNLIMIIAIFAIFIKKMGLGILLILAGGVSNLFDRIWRGRVVDWMCIPLFPWRFNLADIGITLGIVLIIYRFLPAQEWHCGYETNKPKNNFWR